MKLSLTLFISQGANFCGGPEIYQLLFIMNKLHVSNECLQACSKPCPRRTLSMALKQLFMTILFVSRGNEGLRMKLSLPLIISQAAIF